jgi:predicted GTPase
LKASEFNIAVTGNSRVGKSSHIKSLRGLKANYKGANAVDVDETTDVLIQYIHTYNENIIIWVLLGMGTRRYPKSIYLKDVGLFDFFLIITAFRFTENCL